jgi:hypothetical protein
LQFLPFPKLARLNREIVITEKLDGTNAQVYITETMDPFSDENLVAVAKRPVPDGFGRWEVMFAGSRTKWITPEKGNDNAGFAAWVKEHSEELFQLGPGQHFGEWWGGKIQRGYGLKEKRFSLFNVHRWSGLNSIDRPKCCEVVPILASGLFSTQLVTRTLDMLRENGSYAAPGFMQPEGIVIYHTAALQMFKVTLEGDESPKSLQSLLKAA